MTRAELATWLRQQLGQPVDDRIIDYYLTTHPSVKVEEPEGFKLLPTAIRLVPSVAGSVIGAAGFLPGEVAGGAIGTGIGELAAQIYEYLSEGKPFRPSEMAAATAIGAIPFGGEASVLKSALKGSGIGAASSVLEDVIGKQTAPDVKKATESALWGLAFGGTGRSLFPRKAIVEGEEKAIPAVVEKELTQATTKPVAPHEPTHLVDQIKQEGPAKIIEEIKKETTPTEKGALRTISPATELPPDRPRTADELRSFKSVKAFPEGQREAFLELLDQSNQQRRGVQPIERMEAAATTRPIPLDLVPPGSTMGPEDIIAHRNAWTTIMDEVQQLEPKVAEGTATPAERLLYQKKLDQARVIGLNWTGAVSESARVLRVQQEQAQRMALIESDKLQALLDSPAYKGNVEKLARDRQATQGDPQKELELFLRNRRPGFWRQAQNYIQTSLLSALTTPERKFLGDAMNMLANVAVHPFAVGADVVRSAVKGTPRTIFMRELKPQTLAMAKAVPSAVKEALFVLEHGYSLKHIEAFAKEGLKALEDIHPELPGGIATNYSRRLLEAITTFFYDLAHTQEATGRAVAYAIRKGAKTPEQIDKLATEFLTSGSPEAQEALKAAERFAGRAVFTNPPGPLTQAFLAYKRQLPGIAQTLLTFLAPVVRIPSNILVRGLETSPVGFLMKEAAAGGREGAQALGRAALGTLALAPFMIRAAQGQLSGVGPRDAKERAKRIDRGWRPNSIKIGDTWVGIHLFQPFATEMAIAASAYERFMESQRTDQDADDAWSTALKMLFGAGRSVFDQSYFADLAALQRALDNPDERNLRKLGINMAQDLVPYSGLLRRLTHATDPFLREPSTVMEGVKTILPGLSQTVPPQLTRFGQPMVRPGGPLQRFFSPVEISPEAPPDPVQALLDELKLNISKPTGRLTSRGQTLPLSESDRLALQVAQGQAHRQILEWLLGRPGLTKEDVERELDRATTDINNRARALVLRKQPLTPQKLLRKPDLKLLAEAYPQ